MRAIYVIGALLALMLLAAPVAAASSTDPTFEGIIPTCTSGNDAVPSEDCGNTYFRLKPTGSGTEWTWEQDSDAYGNPYKLTLVTEDGTLLSWSVTGGTFAGEIRVKGGEGGYCTYTYLEDDKWTEDSGLHAPVNPSGKYAGISHVSVCGNVIPDEEKLTVEKTADTSYTRTHEWSISKSVTTKNEHDGFPKIWLYVDGSGDETATWTVDVTHKGYEDSNHKVTGEITIENTGKVDAVITKIEDLLGDTPVTVDCGEAAFPYTLPVGETLTCTYCADGFVGGTNKVTVTTARGNEYSANAEIEWDKPTNEFYKTVTIKDVSDLFGEQNFGSVTAPDGGHFTYTKDFKWANYGKGGDFTYGNTASIVETEQSADATLKVNVQGYSSETAYAKGEDNSAVPFCLTFNNWGWTNPITPGEYTWPLWAGAGQCDTSKGTLVGTVTVDYGADGKVSVTYNVPPNILENTHVYAGYDPFPKDRKGNPTVAPGQYTNEGPFDGTTEVYVIAHAVVRIPDPNFGPQPPI